MMRTVSQQQNKHSHTSHHHLWPLNSSLFSISKHNLESSTVNKKDAEPGVVLLVEQVMSGQRGLRGDGGNEMVEHAVSVPGKVEGEVEDNVGFPFLDTELEYDEDMTEVIQEMDRSNRNYLPKVFAEDVFSSESKVDFTALYEENEGDNEVLLLDVWEDSYGDRRLASSSFNDLGTAVRLVAGDPDAKLDVDVQRLIVGTASLAGCFATFAAFSGAGFVAGPWGPVLVLSWGAAACPLAGLLGGAMCDGCFGNPDLDNAWIRISAANVPYGDGDSFAVAYHRANGERDNNHVGTVDKGGSIEEYEDLDASNLIMLEFFVHDTNDICLTNIINTVGVQPSGRNNVETLPLDPSTIGYITQGIGFNIDDVPCIWWGDEEGSLTNFRINWPSALICRDHFFMHNTHDYAKCLTYAMHSFDYVKDGKILRRNFNYDGLPQSMRAPWQGIKNFRGGCIDLQDYNTQNLQPINVRNCRTWVTAQQWDYDSEGHIRSTINPTKCLEAGKHGNLYDKVFLYTCNDTLHQKWIVTSSGRLKNKKFNKYLGIAYCDTRKSETRRLELRDYEEGDCGEAQRWHHYGYWK